MDNYTIAKKILEDNYSDNTILSFATCGKNMKVKNREMNFFYHDKCFYATTPDGCTKLKEVSENPNVALNKGFLKILGTAMNIGSLFDEENLEIHELVKDKFSSFYSYRIKDNAMILKISISSAVVTDDKYLYIADFINERAKKIDKPIVNR